MQPPIRPELGLTQSQVVSRHRSNPHGIDQILKEVKPVTSQPTFGRMQFLQDLKRQLRHEEDREAGENGSHKTASGN